MISRDRLFPLPWYARSELKLIDKFFNSFRFLLFKALYWWFPKKDEFSIRETVASFGYSSYWVIAISFGVLVSSLLGVASKVTFFYHKDLCDFNFLMSDNALFLICSSIFLILSLLYIRLFVIIKNIEDDERSENQRINFVRYYEEVEQYKNEIIGRYYSKLLFRIVLVLIYLLLFFLIDHGYNFIEIYNYQINSDLFKYAVFFIFMMVFIIEFPVWYLYFALKVLFGENREYQVI